MPTVGRRATKNHTQSVIFYKNVGWTISKSKDWLKRNKYYTDGLDETEATLRFRQYDPNSAKFRYRNKVIEKKNNKPSIMLALGYLK